MGFYDPRDGLGSAAVIVDKFKLTGNYGHEKQADSQRLK
jgi:hypothetical protein